MVDVAIENIPISPSIGGVIAGSSSCTRKKLLVVVSVCSTGVAIMRSILTHVLLSELDMRKLYSILSPRMKKIYHYIKHFTNRITRSFSSLHFTTPVAVIVGALIIGGSILGYGFIMKPTASTNLQLFTGRPVDSTDYIEGNKKSDIFLIEYSDPECPYCISVHPTMKEIRAKYENKIAFVYRHFPLTQIHAKAYDESRAIACAGTVGGDKKYYEYIDALYGYKSTKQNTNTPSDLPPTGKEDLARSIGLDIQAFTSCMNNQITANIVNTDMTDGITAGVQGTPSSFLLVKSKKGYEVVAMIDGARQLQYFEAAITQALSR